MFGEVLIMIANGFSHKSPFNMSINIQMVVGTIPSTHFSTANAVLFVEMKGILGFISFPIVKTQGIWGFIAFPAQTHEIPHSSLLQLNILFYLIHITVKHLLSDFSCFWRLQHQHRRVNMEQHGVKVWETIHQKMSHIWPKFSSQISAYKTVLKSYEWL